ncbi:MAG: ATP-dependent helicase, partial [Candidatus Chloroheliales bacterium]
MNLDTLLKQFRESPLLSERITAWREIPAQPAVSAPFPNDLHPALAAALRERGIGQLYSHQVAAWDAVKASQHVAVVTPTASGKTLCYN